jgi:hypothetical protein
MMLSSSVFAGATFCFFFLAARLSHAQYRGPQLLSQGSCLQARPQPILNQDGQSSTPGTADSNISAWEKRASGQVRCAWRPHGWISPCSGNDFSFNHVGGSGTPNYVQDVVVPYDRVDSLELIATASRFSDEFIVHLSVITEDTSAVVIPEISSGILDTNIRLLLNTTAASFAPTPGGLGHKARVRITCIVGGNYCDATLAMLRLRPFSATRPFPAHGCADSADASADGTEPDGTGGVLNCGCGKDQFATPCGCACTALTVASACSGGAPGNYSGQRCGMRTNECGNFAYCGNCSSPHLDCDSGSSTCVCRQTCAGRCGMIPGSPSLVGCPQVCGACGSDETCNNGKCDCNGLPQCSTEPMRCGVWENACGRSQNCSSNNCPLGLTCVQRRREYGECLAVAASSTGITSLSRSSATSGSDGGIGMLFIIVVAGSVCFVLLLIGVVFVVWRRRNRQRESTTLSDPAPGTMLEHRTGRVEHATQYQDVSALQDSSHGTLTQGYAPLPPEYHNLRPIDGGSDDDYHTLSELSAGAKHANSSEYHNMKPLHGDLGEGAYDVMPVVASDQR